MTQVMFLLDPPQVEKEVEHDSRIRRSYKNVRGQHNVACWEWIGPSSATFESVGVRKASRTSAFATCFRGMY